MQKALSAFSLKPPPPPYPKYTDTHAHGNEKQAFLESVTSFINSPYAQSHAILHSATDAAINLFL